MKTTKRLLLIASSILLSAMLPSAMTQAQQQQEGASGNLYSLISQTKHITPLRSNDVPEGSRVTLSADSPLTDAVNYRSGDRFIVVIPQARASSVQSDLRGRGFVDVQIEQRGDDVALSFRLQPGANAHVSQKFNKLEIVFTSPDALIAEAKSVVNNPQPPATSTLPRSFRSRFQTNHPLQAPPDLASILNALFPGKAEKVTADTSNVDLSVPESPAFTVLGFTPNSVVRPATPRALATSLLNGLDQNGNFQTGLAIDTTPFMLFNGENVTIKDYNDFYMTRLLSRTQFSLGATKGASADDTATRLAVGLNITLWDEGDARIYHPERGEEDVLTCFNMLALPPVIPPLVNTDDPTKPPTPAQVAAHDAMVLKINTENQAANNRVADECRKTARKANWNRSSWVIAYAPSWISKTGETSKFKWNGGALWTSVAYGFEQVPSLRKIGQLVFHARYRTKERVEDPDNKGQFTTQDTTFAGVRFRAGSPAFGLNIEDSFIRNKLLGRKIDSSNRFSVGAEARVTDNLYFVITAGGNVGRDDDKNKGFMMTSFKYGFNKKSQFNPQPAP
jgi:hypothetical protein